MRNCVSAPSSLSLLLSSFFFLSSSFFTSSSDVNSLSLKSQPPRITLSQKSLPSPPRITDPSLSLSKSKSKDEKEEEKEEQYRDTKIYEVKKLIKTRRDEPVCVQTRRDQGQDFMQSLLCLNLLLLILILVLCISSISFSYTGR